MVEGPGCTLNGEKLRRLGRRKLLQLVASGSNAALIEKLKSLEGKVLNGAESLGKELFVYFDGASLCLRLHFGMNGSIYVGGQVRFRKRAFGRVLTDSIPRDAKKTATVFCRR